MYRITSDKIQKWNGPQKSKAIHGFKDPELQFLDNTFRTPILGMDDITFPSVERAFAYARLVNAGIAPAPGSALDGFLTISDLGVARMLGNVKNTESWAKQQRDIMGKLLRKKFAPETELAARLLLTGEIPIVSLSSVGDGYWSLAYNHEKRSYEGENVLGQLLMAIRKELQPPISDDTPIEEGPPALQVRTSINKVYVTTIADGLNLENGGIEYIPREKNFSKKTVKTKMRAD